MWARTLSFTVWIFLSIRATCPPAPLMSTSTPMRFKSPVIFPIAPSPSLIISLVTKFRDANVDMKPRIPSLMILADLEPWMESRVSNDTAIMRSNGVAKPMREGMPSTYIMSTDRICSCWISRFVISISATLVACFLDFPFKDAMSGPHMSFAILKSVAVWSESGPRTLDEGFLGRRTVGVEKGKRCWEERVVLICYSWIGEVMYTIRVFTSYRELEPKLESGRTEPIVPSEPRHIVST